jgi:hypothetical protein
VKKIITTAGLRAVEAEAAANKCEICILRSNGVCPRDAASSSSWNPDLDVGRLFPSPLVLRVTTAPPPPHPLKLAGLGISRFHAFCEISGRPSSLRCMSTHRGRSQIENSHAKAELNQILVILHGNHCIALQHGKTRDACIRRTNSCINSSANPSIVLIMITTAFVSVRLGSVVAIAVNSVPFSWQVMPGPESVYVGEMIPTIEVMRTFPLVALCTHNLLALCI